MTDEFAPRKAVKARRKLKLAIDGAGGSGKTKGALALATAIAQQIAIQRGDPQGWKVLGVDTENDSMALYSDEYPFEVINLRAPYTSDRYKRAMQYGISQGFDVLIVDSLSHQWEGSGGIRSRKDALDVAGGNGFANWAKLSPEHTEFLEFIKALDIHMIATMRSKMEYVIEEVNGKKVPRKIGLAPVQREGVDYEFDVVFDLNADMRASVSKDRTQVFAGRTDINLLDPDVARSLWQWLNTGVSIETAKLTDEDVIRLAQLLKAKGVSREDFAAYLQRLGGYASSRDVPRNRIFELEAWISQPREVTNEEKIARQSMEALGMNAGSRQMLINKHHGNWEAINEELVYLADVQTSSPPKNGSAPAREDQDPGEFVFEDPDLFCRVEKAVRREQGNREFFEVTVNGKLGNTNRLTCWHKSRFPALAESEGKQCQFVVSLKKPEYPAIEDVRQIGDRHYQDGKLVESFDELMMTEAGANG